MVLEAIAVPGSRILTGDARDILAVIDAAGATGRIYFSGVSPFAYFKAPDKTAAGTLPGGWQTFGDVGHVDAEGFLFFKGRLKEVIKTSGMNVSPVEVEEVLLSHPEVLTAYCVGIDGMEGEDTMVAAVVVLILGLPHDVSLGQALHLAGEIGRASCRERV